MKQTLLGAVLMAALLGTAFTGCSKDDDNGSNKSKKELMTQKTWKLVKHTMNTVDVTNQLYQSCELDNVYTFSASGNYTITEGTTKCNSSDPDLVDGGAWALRTNDTQIQMDGDLYDIIELNDNTCKIKPNPDTDLQTFTFQH